VDVTLLELPSAASEDDMLKTSRQKCRSEYFVLIHQYTDVTDTFMLGAAMSAESGSDYVSGYRCSKRSRDLLPAGRLRRFKISFQVADSVPTLIPHPLFRDW
jgi:hypothetical protein